MEEHYSPIKTPKQLIIVVVLAFAVLITVPAMLSQLVTSGERGTHDKADLVLARIQPVGTVVLGEPVGPKGMLTGEQVYTQVCKTCHETGLAGAPKIGDKAGWAKIIAQGDKTTFAHAISGLKAMPPKGGNSELTDDEVKRAVVFMVNQAGANWTAPAVTTVAAAPAAASPAPATSAPACCDSRRGTRPRAASPRPHRLPQRARARRSTTAAASPATVRASPTRRSSATRRRGRHGSRTACRRCTTPR